MVAEGDDEKKLADTYSLLKDLWSRMRDKNEMVTNNLGHIIQFGGILGAIIGGLGIWSTGLLIEKWDSTLFFIWIVIWIALLFCFGAIFNGVLAFTTTYHIRKGRTQIESGPSPLPRSWEVLDSVYSNITLGDAIIMLKKFLFVDEYRLNFRWKKMKISLYLLVISMLILMSGFTVLLVKVYFMKVSR